MVFRRLFKKLTESQATKGAETMSSAASAGGQAFTLPHPEEPMDPAARLANIDVTAVINQWLSAWEVPPRYWDYWQTAIDLRVYETYPASVMAMGINQDTPAVTWEEGGRRHLALKPQWLNPGVIAHEQAHNSYALLSPAQKAEFSAVYAPLKDTEPLIRLLYSRNRYGLSLIHISEPTRPY